MLSASNLVALWLDPMSTKLAAVVVPLILYLGISSLFSISKRILLLMLLPLIWLSYSDLSYLLQFNLQTTPGMIEAILQSDYREILEFSQSLPRSTILMGLIYFIVFILLFIFSPKGKLIVSRKKRIIAGLLIILPFVDLIGKGASSNSFPLGFVRSVYVYMSDKKKSQKLVEQRKKFSFGEVTTPKESEHFVLVLGETSRRDYYSLYGYYRNTNPKLSRIKNLALFDNAISPSNATIQSLKSILYMATTEDDSLFYTSPSLIVLANQAGFKTYWLSSQARYGKFDSTTGSTGVAADKVVFTNQSSTVERIYDGKLIPLLDESLNDGVDNKLVVLHLYGSHLSYQQRYPKPYSVFTGEPKGYEGRSKDIINSVNTYSNTILYTDYIVSEVIKTTEKKETPSCVVYTSDHGEYLADDAKNDFTGHGYPLPYKVEVEVPLMVWCNDLYRQQYPQKWLAIQKNIQAKISTEDMFFSMADLLDIKFGYNKPQRSFFNNAYSPLEVRKVRSAADNKLYNYSELP